MRTAQEESRTHTRTIMGLITPAPAVFYGDVIVTKQGPGVFTLRFPSLRKLLSAMVTNMSGAPYLATCAIGADGSLTVWCWNLSGSQVDPSNLSFTALGYPK